MVRDPVYRSLGRSGVIVSMSRPDVSSDSAGVLGTQTILLTPSSSGSRVSPSDDSVSGFRDLGTGPYLLPGATGRVYSVSVTSSPVVVRGGVTVGPVGLRGTRELRRKTGGVRRNG